MVSVRSVNLTIDITNKTNMRNYELIELTIYFENKESESMIVSLDSMAHEFIRDYVKVNSYKLIEKEIAKEKTI